MKFGSGLMLILDLDLERGFFFEFLVDLLSIEGWKDRLVLELRV